MFFLELILALMLIVTSLVSMKAMDSSMFRTTKSPKLGEELSLLNSFSNNSNEIDHCSLSYSSTTAAQAILLTPAQFGSVAMTLLQVSVCVDQDVMIISDVMRERWSLLF